MFIALNLIAVALGYRVFADASKEKKSLRTVGRLIGVFIVSIALGMTLISFAERAAVNCSKKNAYGSKCAVFKKLCSFASKSCAHNS